MQCLWPITYININATAELESERAAQATRVLQADQSTEHPPTLPMYVANDSSTVTVCTWKLVSDITCRMVFGQKVAMQTGK